MSLGVVIKGAEGVVLAADSRVTLSASHAGAPPISINFDNATKLLSFSKPHNFVGAVTYGAAVIGLRTAHSFIPEFELELEDKKRLDVSEYAKLLGEFYHRQWEKTPPDGHDNPSMMFVVGGYDPGKAYGSVFLVDVPRNPEPVERNAGETEFGMTWGGQLQIASRIIQGFDPVLPAILKNELSLDDEQIDKLLGIFKSNMEFSIPYQVLPLQDCVNLATFMIRTTMDAQNLAIGVRGVGGPIDVAIITRTKGIEEVQRKSIKIDMGIP